GNLAEELRDLRLDPAVARDVDLPAGVDADHAHILDAGLRAVARTAGHRELHLVRRPHVEQHLFQIDTHAGRVLRAEAAELAADAGLHGANAFAVSVAARHVQLAPDGGQIVLLHA